MSNDNHNPHEIHDQRTDQVPLGHAEDATTAAATPGTDAIRDDELLTRATSDLAMISDLDPAGTVDAATLVRVRNVVDAAVAAPAHQPQRTFAAWFGATSPVFKIAGAVAAAALVFSGGVVSGPVFGDAGNTSPAPVVASGARTSGTVGAPETAGMAADAAKSAVWSGAGRTHLVDGLGVDQDPQNATGYMLNADDRELKVLAALVAKRFGVTGSPVFQEWGGIQYGDGSNTTVYVNGGNGQIPSWGFSDSEVDPWRVCWSKGDGIAGSSSGASTGAVSSGSATPKTLSATTTSAVDAPAVEPMPISEPVPACSPAPVKQLSSKDAEQRAKELLNGIAPDDLAFDVTGDATYVNVAAYPIVNGKRSTATSWGVSFVGKDVWSAYGSFLTIGTDRSYRIISAKEAVLRANDNRFASYPVYPENWNFENGVKVVPAAGTSDTRTGSAGSAAADRRVPWPVETVTIVSARLGTTPVTSSDGIILVPSWDLSAADGRSWSVIALDDTELDYTATPGYGGGVRPMAENAKVVSSK